MTVIMPWWITFFYRAEVKGKHLRQIILQLAPELSISTTQVRTLNSHSLSSFVHCYVWIVHTHLVKWLHQQLKNAIKHHLYCIRSLITYLFPLLHQWEDGLDQSTTYDPVNISSGSRSDSLLELLQASEERYMVRAYEITRMLWYTTSESVWVVERWVKSLHVPQHDIFDKYTDTFSYTIYGQ